MQKVISNISIDCVIFGFDGKKFKVLLNKRNLKDNNGNIIVNDYKLMGAQVYQDETAEMSAQRILYEVAGFNNIFLTQFHTFSSLERLSKEKDQIWLKELHPGLDKRIITIAYYALVDCNKFSPDNAHKNVKWFPINKLPELAFDHLEIFNKALEELRLKVQHFPIIFELLPEKFSLTQLQTVYEAIFNLKFDRRNFRKKIHQMKFIISLDEKQKDVKHKPALVYIFSKDVYERTKKEKLIFPF